MHSYSGMRLSARNLLRYGVGRMARVYPVYIFSLLVVSPFILADRVADKAPWLAVHGLLLQGWVHPPVGWNTPAWTLSCEVFFYLSFPLLLAGLSGAGWKKTLGLAAVACALTRVMWACGVPDGIKPLVHLADFAMGVAASRAYSLLKASEGEVRGSWLYLPAAALGFLLITWPGLLSGYTDLNTALRPLNAVLLIGLSLGGGLLSRLLSARPAVFLGKASYGMYILHVPILWWYARYARVFSAAAYISLVIGLSSIVYVVLEEPANQRLRMLLAPARARTE
jgi:peptidoglycan/LPS O-acetylase OafA/YrhL